MCQVNDVSEGEVDASCNRLPGFWNTMPPVMLQASTHQQQATAGKIYVQGFPRFIMSNLKQPFRAHAQRSDERIRTQDLFLIGMPTHGILPIPVKIAQYAVKLLPTSVFNGLLKFKQCVCPRLRIMGQPGILVDCAFVAVPAYHARNRNLTTDNSGHFLLPVQFSP